MKKIYFTAFFVIITFQTLIEQGSSSSNKYCKIYRLTTADIPFPCDENGSPDSFSVTDIPECITISIAELIKLVETSKAFTISMYFKLDLTKTDDWSGIYPFLFQLTNSASE